MKELRQDTWMTILNRIPVMLLGFISITILTRWLGPEGNGVYTFIFANVNLLVLLFGLQSETAIVHYMAKKDSNKDEVISLAMFTVGAGFLVCAILLLLGGLLVPGFKTKLVPDGQPHLYFIYFILLSFLFRKSQNTFLAFYRATLRFKAYNLYQLLAQAVPVVLYLFGFLKLNQSTHAGEIIPVFNFILIGQALISLIGVYMVYTRFRPKLTFHFKPLMGDFYAFSFKSTIDAIAKFINRSVDVYFVQAFKGYSTLGLYGLATQINNFAQEAMLPFAQVMNPYLVNSTDEDRVEIVSRMARIIFSISLVICLGILILSPFVIPLLFGQVYKPSILATQILSFSVIISTMRIFFAGYFQSINKQKFNIQSNWLGVLLTIVLDILLIPGFGIEGAAWASIIAYATSCAFIYFHFSKHTKSSLKDIIYLRKQDITWLFRKGKS